MRKLSFGAVTYICLYLPIVALASESGVVFDSSLFDEAPIYDSLLVLDESSSPTYDISTAEEELLLFFDEEELFITATKIPQTLFKAPAIVSVITDDEIKDMGARNILDVLNRIPGFHVTQGYYGKDEIEVRGIKTTDSEKVKILIDGHSVNDNYSGGAVWSFGNLNVSNVKRIEIIRGPGSALYGSNAFSGVINVITKTGADMNGLSVTVGVGSFNSRKLNLQAGKTFNDLDIALSFNSERTEGDSPSFGKDAFGNTGDADNEDKSYDVQLKVAYNDFTLNTKFVNRERGDYLNVVNANTDFGYIDREQYFAELGYSHTFGERTEIAVKAYVDHLHWKSLFEMYSSGLIAGPGIKERTMGVELHLDYKVTEKNLFTLGVMREQRKQYEVIFQGNFDPSGNTSGLFDSVRDISSLGNWNREEKRDISAVYLQDVWSVTDDFELTVGARYDNYSDFGNTTNPRAAAVWALTDDWNLKVLYGKAFRAPSFEQLYNTNNPAVKGSDMDPETMETFELNISNRFREKTKTKLTYFRSNFEDEIRLVSGMYENSGGAKIQGVEFEMAHKYSKVNAFYLNYTYQDARDWETGDVLQDVAAHKGNIGFNHQFAGRYTLNSNIFISSERPRAKGDSRDDMPSYALVDVALRADDVVYKNLGVRATVHNLFDKAYSDPAPQGSVENDYVREGINIMFELSYKYR